jgi:hypothetical protein
LCVPGEQLAREGDARSFAAPGDEHARQLLDVGFSPGAEQRARQQRAPLVGDGREQLLQERNVHDFKTFYPLPAHLFINRK